MTAKSTSRGGVGRGSDDDKINLASLSLCSDPVYLKQTYVIVDPKVERNGSLTIDSLMVQERAEAVTLVLDEKFVGVLYNIYEVFLGQETIIQEND
jgi:hypothetical protein